MEVREVKITNNGKEAIEYKEYTRTTYWCKMDDNWVTTEVPK